MTRAFLSAIGLAAVIALPAHAAPIIRAPVIVAELFTSQGCSSCPPADRLLARLKASEPDVLALDFHVDYWDRLGWKDPFSLHLATQRQEGYAASLQGEAYTPQLVVGGRRAVIGSDTVSVAGALAQARVEQTATPAIALGVTRAGEHVVVTLGADAHATSGELILVGFDPQRTTTVGRGENSGRTLTEVNVVRSLRDLGHWDGGAVRLDAAAPAGQSAAVLVQRQDGSIVAAAVAAP